MFDAFFGRLSGSCTRNGFHVISGEVDPDRPHKLRGTGSSRTPVTTRPGHGGSTSVHGAVGIRVVRQRTLTPPRRPPPGRPGRPAWSGGGQSRPPAPAAGPPPARTR